MFDNERFSTRGIHENIPLVLQVIIWQMIDDLKEKKKKIDYLQMFELEFDTKCLKIHHSSERPKYSNTFQFHVGGVVADSSKASLTIWVMNEKQYSLIMFPEER